MAKRKAHLRKEHDHKYWIGSRTSPDRHLESRHIKEIYVSESKEGVEPLLYDFTNLLYMITDEYFKKFNYKTVRTAVRKDLKSQYDRYLKCDVPWELVSGFMECIDFEIDRAVKKKIMEEEQQNNANV